MSAGAPTVGGTASRTAILDAAEALMLERGYERAGVAAICRAAGLPTGSLYHHFGSKPALLAAVVDRFSERFFAGLELPENGSGAAGLEPYWRAAVEAVVENRTFFLLDLDLTTLSQRDAALAAALEPATARAARHLTAAFSAIATADDASPTERDDRGKLLSRVTIMCVRGAVAEVGGRTDDLRQRLWDVFRAVVGATDTHAAGVARP